MEATGSDSGCPRFAYFIDKAIKQKIPLEARAKMRACSQLFWPNDRNSRFRRFFPFESLFEKPKRLVISPKKLYHRHAMLYLLRDIGLSQDFLHFAEYLAI